MTSSQTWNAAIYLIIIAILFARDIEYFTTLMTMAAFLVLIAAVQKTIETADDH